MRAPRKFWTGIVLGVCLTAASCIGSCKQSTVMTAPTSTAAQSVTVTPSTVQLTVGQTQQFTASVLPSTVSQAVTWSVTPTTVASIDSTGKLTALASGQATVNAASVATPTITAAAGITVSAAMPAPPLYIRGRFLSVLNGPNYLADSESVQVCTDSTCATPVTDATVTVNGTTLAYDSLKLRYTANFTINPGTALSFKASRGGFDYTASGTQFTTFPSLTTPAPGASWDAGVSNMMSWTSGSPMTGATNFLGVIDKSGKIYYPSGNKPLELGIGSTSYTIPSGWTSVPGDYYVYNGIGTPGIGNSGAAGIPVSNAASGSGVFIGGITTLSLVHVF